MLDYRIEFRLLTGNGGSVDFYLCKIALDFNFRPEGAEGIEVNKGFLEGLHTLSLFQCFRKKAEKQIIDLVDYYH